MLELFEKTFAPYAPCVTEPREVFLTGYDWQIKAYLDDSFAFLINKPSSLPTGRGQFYSFLAGLVDSDCSLCLFEDKGKAAHSFVTSSESQVPLEEAKRALEKECFHVYLYLSREKGTTKIINGMTQSREVKLSMICDVLRFIGGKK